tara:strand:- start:779 stop:1927 length:1149 start_codon:yes stop_codon:yes gene_type:complete
MGKKVAQLPKVVQKVAHFEEKSSAVNLGKNRQKFNRKKNYVCILCAYETKNISNFKKHIKSKKHIKNQIINEKNENGKIPKSPKKNGKKSSAISKIFECKFCSEISFSKTSYYRHNVICSENPMNFKKNEIINEKNEEYELLEKNKELAKKVELLEKKLVEQKVEALEEQLKLKDETINAYQNGGNVTNNNFKNNTFNTNNISINMFLNETCKNAMNLTDFVNQIKVQLEDVMYTQKHGPEKGITNILVKQLEDVPITERPIHCADVKRKKFYVKDNHEWRKTQPSKELNENEGTKGPIERCIRNLKSKQHLIMETEWKKQNPDHATNPEKKDEYLDIENKIWKGCAKGESWSDYMKKMEKDISEWSLPSLKEEMDEVNKLK